MFKIKKWCLVFPLLISLLLISSICYQVVEAEAPSITSQFKTQEIGKKIVTAYNSVVSQTDNSPCISASGLDICKTEKLICACPREYPFGTRFLIDGQIYFCEDRLHEKYDDRIDLLMKTDKEAKQWGKRLLEVKIIDD